MKLIIVDDSKIMRRTIRSIVAEQTDTIIECEDGSHVLEAYEKERPDFVLMDLNMAIMNGIEATKILKSKFPEARVLVITNYHEDEFRNEANATGVEKYFIKDNLIEVKEYLIQERN